MNKKYIVRLTAEECRTLREVVKQLKGSSQKIRRAQAIQGSKTHGIEDSKSVTCNAWQAHDVTRAMATSLESFVQRLYTSHFNEKYATEISALLGTCQGNAMGSR